jgi:hypothetical protein
MNLICCTIVTPSHINKAVTLLESLKKSDERFNLVILVTEPVTHAFDSIEMVNLQYLITVNEAAALVTEKYSFDSDVLRWSLKPVLLCHLLAIHKDAFVIYCDCDMYFFSSPVRLIAGLRRGGIVLTPHWRPLEPAPSIHSFRLNFQDGLFNAGCVAANRKGLPALKWWVRACLSGCEVDRASGLYHDQRYLDLIMIYFPNTVICRDKGYNVADWNHHARYEPIRNNLQICLIHFSANTIKKILAGKDPMLEPYFSIYTEHLNKSHHKLRTDNVICNRLPDELEKA